MGLIRRVAQVRDSFKYSIFKRNIHSVTGIVYFYNGADNKVLDNG